MATPHAKIASVGNVQWVVLVNHQGDSGTLTGLGVSGGPDYHHFRVHLDGQPVIADGQIAGQGLSEHTNNGLGVALPFTSTLYVEGRDSPNPSGLARYWVTWVTDHSRPVEQYERTEAVAEMEYIYQTTVYEKDDGERYAVDALVGPLRTATVVLHDDVVSRAYPDLTLRGHVESESASGRVSAVIQVAGRSTVLTTVPLFVDEPTTIEDVPPVPGHYSITTKLDGFANVPAFFTVL